MSKNLSELSGRKGLKNNLFEEIGNKAQAIGTVSSMEIKEIAEEYLVGSANILGTSSFYDFLKAENKGKKAYVCNGSSCLTAGTQDKIKSELGKHYEQNEIGEMCCLGRCHENSSFSIDGKNYSGSDIEKIAGIKNGGITLDDTYKVGLSGKAVLTNDFTGIQNYYSLFQKVLQNESDKILDEIKLSGLRGRGGAGFPMGFKLESCKNTPSDQKYIVCNADEGDPGAYSDRYLLEQRPHSVLYGMMLAGFIAGAADGVLYIRAEYPQSISVVNNAIEDLRNAKLIGNNILGSDFSFDFKVIKAQGAYICGEETALLSSIEGQRPEVRVRPPYPTQQGLFNKPTVVNNVETLACLPFVLENGGKEFASIGKGKSTGTKLVSLDSFFNNPGIYEVEMGTPLKFVVENLGGGFRKKIKAMHIGGPLGGLVPVSKIDSLDISFESFSQNGFLLGHASVVCIPDDFPIIAYLEHLFAFTAHESCGKCFPCRLGSMRGKELIQKARSADDYKIDRNLFNDLLETLEIGSLCALGGGLPLPVKNSLKYFNSELSEYFN